MEKLKLANAPLILVLAQVRFTPVLKIESYISEIQDVLRISGFPRFEEEVTQELQIVPGAENQPRVRSSKRWIFGAPDRKNSVILTDSFVVLETASYNIFETFCEQLGKVLDVIDGKLKPSYIERIGLRYIDLIKDTPQIKSSECLQPGMRGLAEVRFKDSEPAMHSSIATTETPLGRLVVRAVQLNDGSFLPPDLVSTKLDINASVQVGAKITVLDIDHYGECSFEFKSPQILEHLTNLHTYTDEAFKAVVTKEAIQSWM